MHERLLDPKTESQGRTGFYKVGKRPRAESSILIMAFFVGNLELL